jgi:hypothetical protein
MLNKAMSQALRISRMRKNVGQNHVKINNIQSNYVVGEQVTYTLSSSHDISYCTGKEFHVQTLRGSEGFRMLRLPEFLVNWHMNW